MTDHINGHVNPTLNTQDEESDRNATEKEKEVGTSVQVEMGRTEKVGESHKLLFSVDDVPPWHVSLLLGFQHYLTMFGGTISLPFILTPALCIEESDPVRSSIVSTIIFVSGIITLLQCTFGVRLPIIQGATFAFLVPTFAILNLPQWQCPPSHEIANMTYENKTELWQVRMREVQGAIIVAAIFQVLLGAFGIVGLILRFITPLTIAPAITMVGLTLFQVSGRMAGQHWGISAGTMILIMLFSQYLRNVGCPLPRYRFSKDPTQRGWTVAHLHIFVLLPILLTVIIMWVLCIILTATDVFEPGSAARTDIKLRILHEAPWFRVPYPGQWGLPTVSVAAVFGMLAGVIASAIESIGDYYACARLSGASPPPIHAINRGMTIEGLGCILAGIWGSGSGTTSYSENIGAIGITKVGSRRVIQAAAVMMLVFGLFSKFGALFITIPEPIIGGIFCITFGMIAATGISNVQFIDLNSSRNLMILGFSIFFSLVLSQWMSVNPKAINTGSEIADQIFTVLLSTNMFVAGVLGFVLDNTVPGTDEERGLTKWLQKPEVNDSTDLPGEGTYDLPLITPWLKRQNWASYIPFLPSYKSRPWISCSQLKRNNTSEFQLTRPAN